MLLFYMSMYVTWLHKVGLIDMEYCFWSMKDVSIKRIKITFVLNAIINNLQKTIQQWRLMHKMTEYIYRNDVIYLKITAVFPYTDSRVLDKQV